MKTPQFEEMAKRWKSDADVYIVYQREAHPNGKDAKPLAELADKLMAADKDGDHAVTFEEFGGPRPMFTPFDVNNDGIVQPHELLAARKITQFNDVAAPETMEARLALARRFRDEVPGDIPVLVDGIDNAVSLAYGRRPNSAFVIGGDGKITHKFEWASVRATEAALAEVLGKPAPQQAKVEADWSALAEPLVQAAARKRPLLVQFTAPGCGACERMEASTLKNPEVVRAMADFEFAKVGVEEDEHWALFEALDLSATPAFAVVEPGRAPRVLRRSQGLVTAEPFAAFLGG